MRRDQDRSSRHGYAAGITPEELVSIACPIIGRLGGSFYFAPETRAVGKELGLDAFRFYFLGRGGVLGDVEWPVVASAFGYFHPALVERIWDSARARLDPREAGRAYVAACGAFGRAHLADVAGLETFCDRAARVDAAADVAGLALYAGLSAEPRSDEPAARALQLIAVLRELRGSSHLLAVRACGVAPRVAHAIRRPDDVATFGWSEAEVGSFGDDDRARLAEADRLTDRLVLPAFAVLDPAEADDLVTVLRAMDAALAA